MIQLLNKQRRFITSDNRLVVFMAGIASGKTFIGAIWATLRALRGRKVLVLEPTFAMCRDVFLPTLVEVFEIMGFKSGVDYTVNLSTTTVKLRNGEILIRSAEAAERLRGLNMNDLLIDEFASLKTDNPYKIAIGRLRLSDDAQIRLVGTPTPVKWIRNLLDTEGCELIRQSTIDNFFLPQSYVDDLKLNYGEGSQFYRQEVLGELVEFGMGVLKSDWFKLLPSDIRTTGQVRSWDLAFTVKKKSDYSATCRMSKVGDRYIIHHTKQYKLEWPDLRKVMITQAKKDGPQVKIYVESFAGQIALVNDLQREPQLNGYTVIAIAPKGDKLNKVIPFAGVAEAGLVDIVTHAGQDDLFDQMNGFDGSGVDHDDLIDSLALAYHAIGKNTVIRPAKITGLY